MSQSRSLRLSFRNPGEHFIHGGCQSALRIPYLVCGPHTPSLELDQNSGVNTNKDEKAWIHDASRGTGVVGTSVAKQLGAYMTGVRSSKAAEFVK
ncbi:hypothetical protein BDV93DRAFT_294774 [Ceratobasidium sp. AG-I]|nr:hypothetical protein BDV93DRAFT_294774 [Ceratobasidium sp. AG-I]